METDLQFWTLTAKREKKFGREREKQNSDLTVVRLMSL